MDGHPRSPNLRRVRIGYSFGEKEELFRNQVHSDDIFDKDEMGVRKERYFEQNRTPFLLFFFQRLRLIP